MRHLANAARHVLVVLGQQYQLALSLGRDARGRDRFSNFAGPDTGQHNGERGPGTDLGSDFDVPSVVLNDTVDDRQSQPGALPTGLRAAARDCR